ncbi:MAG: ABC transporter permease subunit [Lachnospiraceae bacterium]|nr:ABC transporter permease subunit [Lachnospiraceae bacterium]
MIKYIKKILPVICWIIIWQILALIINNDILLAGPIETVRALIGLSFTADFYRSILSSLVRILLGFVLGVSFGILLGFLSSQFNIIREFLKPIFLLMRSVPVASFVIILLIWLGNKNTSIFICMIVTMPVLYHDSLEGIDATDSNLLEMCKVYNVGLKKKIHYVYFPQLYPFLLAAMKLAVGMSFKSGVAAEVIGQPLNTMGNGLYLSKIYLETDELFAWTIAIVVLTAIVEKIVLFILNLMKPGGDVDD